MTATPKSAGAAVRGGTVCVHLKIRQTQQSMRVSAVLLYVSAMLCSVPGPRKLAKCQARCLIVHPSHTPSGWLDAARLWKACSPMVSGRVTTVQSRQASHHTGHRACVRGLRTVYCVQYVASVGRRQYQKDREKVLHSAAPEKARNTFLYIRSHPILLLQRVQPVLPCSIKRRLSQTIFDIRAHHTSIQSFW